MPIMLSGLSRTVFASVVMALLWPYLPLQAQQKDIPQRVTGSRALEAATRLDYLFDGQTAIRLMPAELAVGPGVTHAEWSPDGRYVLAVRVPRSAEPTFAVPASVVLWDKTTHRSTEIWSRRLAMPVLSGPIQWSAKAQVGILHWRWMESDDNGAWGVKEGMVWVNAARGAARELDSQFGDSISLSPPSTGGVILHGDSRIALQSVSVIAPDGSVSPPLLVPDGAQERQVRWQADGKLVFIEVAVPVSEQEAKDSPKGVVQGFGVLRRNQWFAIDTMRPQIVALDKAPAGIPPLPNSVAPPQPLLGAGENGLHVKAVPTTLKQGAVETLLHPLWLETAGAKPMSALLCAEGERAQIAPSGNAVLYLAQTRVWVTTLQRTPRPLFTASILTAHQDEVMYRAWTLAQAVRMWSADHQGMLPAPDDAVAALQSLMPTESLYEGFRYVWPGGALPVGARPTETIVAEILGPGGCAQIFADRHIAWKSSE